MGACAKCGSPTDDTRDLCENCARLRAASVNAPASEARVVITRIDVPFGQLVALGIKVMFAAVPAGLIGIALYSVARMALARVNP